MNRAERRKLDRKVRTKLTDEQYKDFRKVSVREFIDIEVKRQLDDIWRKMSEELIQIMRRHRISEDRVSVICSEFYETMMEKYEEVNRDEGLPE